MESAAKRPKLETGEDSFHDYLQTKDPQVSERQVESSNNVTTVQYSLDSIPKEIIHEICQLLSVRDKLCLRLVNRRLYTICSDPRLLSRVVIDDAYHKTNGLYIRSVIKTCQPHVESLSLRGHIPFSQYQSIILNCRNVNELNLYGFEIKHSALQKVVSGLPHLRVLTINYESDDSSLDMESLSSLSHLKKLVVILHAWARSLFEKWLRNKCLPHDLVVVNKGYSIDLRNSSVYPPPIPHTAHFTLYSRYRRPLNFAFRDVPEYTLQCGPTSSSVNAITANGELEIKLSDVITPTGGPDRCGTFNDRSIPTGLPVYDNHFGANVTLLNFAYVTVSLETFRHIMQATPNLLEVSLFQSTITYSLDAYLVPLSEHCLHLKGLNVARVFTKATTGDHLTIDKEHFWDILSRIKYLESLTISCCSLLPPISDSQSVDGGSSRVSHISDIDYTARDVMINFIKSMTRLRGIHIIHCKGVQCTECCEYNYSTEFVNHGAQYLIRQHLLPMVSNLTRLCYLRIDFPPPRMSGICIVQLEEILHNCQQLSALIIINADVTLPADPAIYSSLIHLMLDTERTNISLSFINALAINSRKQLKHFAFVGNVEEDILMELVESCSFVTFYMSSRSFRKRKETRSLARKKYQYCNISKYGLPSKLDDTDFGDLHNGRY